ncbi:MAG: hypothetical protein AAB874_04850, partial [Patescibacteria group bacterium]
MRSYIFLLGKAQELCRAELFHVLKSYTIPFHEEGSGNGYVVVKFDSPIDSQLLLSRTGGTVKIAHLISTSQILAPELLTEIIASDQKKKKITFGLSVIGQEKADVVALTKSIKNQLIKKGFQTRFVLPENTQLSSVVVQKQHVAEYILIFENKTNRWLVGLTEATQHVDEWARRDRGRPWADPKSGMLPPKVARMMVNIAISNPITLITLLDPFCGMGTILGEALLLGWRVVGSDIHEEVMLKAKKNLDWLQSEYSQIHFNYHMVSADATHISEKMHLQNLDAIVTEPYLGAPLERRGEKIFQHGALVSFKEISNTMRGLEKLYIGALREWHSLLKKGGKVVIAFPAVDVENREFSVKKTVDMCENLGYTLEQGTYPYFRPQAVV